MNTSSSVDTAPMCAICMCQISDSLIGIPNNCAHMYCSQCILTWSESSRTCPIDRKDYTSVIIKAFADGEVLDTVPLLPLNGVMHNTDSPEGVSEITAETVNLTGSDEETWENHTFNRRNALENVRLRTGNTGTRTLVNVRLQTISPRNAVTLRRSARLASQRARGRVLPGPLSTRDSGRTAAPSSRCNARFTIRQGATPHSCIGIRIQGVVQSRESDDSRDSFFDSDTDSVMLWSLSDSEESLNSSDHQMTDDSSTRTSENRGRRLNLRNSKKKREPNSSDEGSENSSDEDQPGPSNRAVRRRITRRKKATASAISKNRAKPPVNRYYALKSLYICSLCKLFSSTSKTIGKRDKVYKCNTAAGLKKAIRSVMDKCLNSWMFPIQDEVMEALLRHFSNKREVTPALIRQQMILTINKLSKRLGGY